MTSLGFGNPDTDPNQSERGHTEIMPTHATAMGGQDKGMCLWSPESTPCSEHVGEFIMIWKDSIRTPREELAKILKRSRLLYKTFDLIDNSECGLWVEITA